MNKATKRALVVTAVAGLGIGASGLGVAVAVAPSWSASKDGNGTGKAKKIDFTVVGDTAGATLYPGSTGGDVVYKIHNTSGFDLVLSHIAQTAASTVLGCTTPAITVSDVLPTSTSLADGATVTFTSAALAMGASSNNCQDATLTVPLTVTATSVN